MLRHTSRDGNGSFGPHHFDIRRTCLPMLVGYRARSGLAHRVEAVRDSPFRR